MGKGKAQNLQNIETEVLEPVIEKYIFNKPLQGDEAKAVYAEVKGRIEKDFKNAPVFNNYFEFNEQTKEINGSNLYYGILINDSLSKNGLWLPTITQAKKLDKKGRLSNNVYRDYGIVVFNDDNPNKDVAKRLIKEANKRVYQLPILVPFKALKLIKTGTQISFNKDTEAIISGEEAKQYLENEFDYKGESGACRLGRSGIGNWYADWNRLDISNGGGRVDFVCGEATAKNLETAVLSNINELAQKEVEVLNARIASARETVIQALRS